MNDDKYSTSKWRHLARRVLSYYNFQDQVKRRFGKMEQAEMVHHALPAEDFPEYFFHPKNLVPVSRSTHRGLHNDDGTLTAAGIDVARRAARNIGVDVSAYLDAQKRRPRTRNDAGRYQKSL